MEASPICYGAPGTHLCLMFHQINRHASRSHYRYNIVRHIDNYPADNWATLTPTFLREIFQWTRVLSGDECEASENIFAISMVCTRWRRVSVACPRLWQVVSLRFTLPEDMLIQDALDKSRATWAIDDELDKLRHYVLLSHCRPLGIRLTLPALPATVALFPEADAEGILMDCIKLIIRGLGHVTERIDQLTVIAPSKKELDYMTYLINYGLYKIFDTDQLFYKARMAQFLCENDFLEEIPLEPVPSHLPDSIQELILTRPVHQWWRMLDDDFLRSRLAGTMSIIFHQPLNPHFTQNSLDHFFRLMSIVSQLRSLQYRDDSKCYELQDAALGAARESYDD